MTNKRVRHPKGGKSYKLSYNSSFQIFSFAGKAIS